MNIYSLNNIHIHSQFLKESILLISRIEKVLQLVGKPDPFWVCIAELAQLIINLALVILAEKQLIDLSLIHI